MLQLKKLREQINLSQKDLASLIDKSHQAYNFYEQGKREPDLVTLVKLADVFRVSVDTLLNHTPLNKDGHKQDVTPDERHLLKIYRELDADHRKSLLDYINFLSNQQQEENAKKEQVI